MDSSEPVGQPWQYSKEYHTISDFLGVNIYDRNDSELHKKVSAIQEWGGGEDVHKVLTQVSKLRKELGVQFIGKPLVKELYQSIRLKQDGKRANADIEQNPIIGKTKAPDNKTKGSPLQKIVSQAVTQTVQQSVTELVKQTLNDKKVVSSLVQDAVKGALK